MLKSGEVIHIFLFRSKVSAFIFEIGFLVCFYVRKEAGVLIKIGCL
jgi:hypothetical protein